MTEQVQLDWATAEVSDGELTVRLTAKPPKQWRAAFERTAALLGAGNWEVTLKPKKALVQIASVRPGDEERVRQFAEGAVLEANTTLDNESEGDDDDQESVTNVPEPSSDAQLTDRFRAFAGGQHTEAG
jgi:hypothetical protein